CQRRVQDDPTAREVAHPARDWACQSSHYASHEPTRDHGLSDRTASTGPVQDAGISSWRHLCSMGERFAGDERSERGGEGMRSAIDHGPYPPASYAFNRTFAIGGAGIPSLDYSKPIWKLCSV